MGSKEPKTAYVQRLVFDSLRAAEVVRGVLVLAAVSGGRDSVVMLHCLKELQPRFGYRLEAVHVEHGMRGGDALLDAAFVEKLCFAWQIPCHTAHVDVPGRVAETGESPEEAARILRYEAIGNAARRAEAAWIAVAHHADDQAETMLLGISRGSLGMLRGMRQTTEDARGRILRPLLYAGRSDIDVYAQEQALSWREDESNGDPAFIRNRIRKTVMPFLRQELDANLTEHLTLLSDRLREEDALLEKLAAACASKHVLFRNAEGTLVRNGLEGEEDALVRRVLEKVLQKEGCARSSRTVEDIRALFRAQPGKRILLKEAHEALRERDGVLIRKIRERDTTQVPLALPGTTQTPWGTFYARPAQICGDPKTQGFAQWIPCVQTQLQVRLPRRAERIAPLGMEGTKLVSDVFSDAGVLLAAREDWPVVADATGPVWIPGLCADRRLKVNAQEAAYFIEFIRKGTRENALERID